MKAEKTVVLSVTKKVVRMAEYWEYMKADMMEVKMVGWKDMMTVGM